MKIVTRDLISSSIQLTTNPVVFGRVDMLDIAADSGIFSLDFDGSGTVLVEFSASNTPHPTQWDPVGTMTFYDSRKMLQMPNNKPFLGRYLHFRASGSGAVLNNCILCAA